MKKIFRLENQTFAENPTERELVYKAVPSVKQISQNVKQYKNFFVPVKWRAFH